MYRPRLKLSVRHQWLAQAAEPYVPAHQPVADNRYLSVTRLLGQQWITRIRRPLPIEIQDDPPALTPVTVDAMNHHTLVARDGHAPGITNPVEQRLRGLLPSV